MTKRAIGAQTEPGTSLTLPLVAVFGWAIFLSAFLLFAIQPMFTKMALPLLGGAPNVWNTAMVFFQGILLAGYIYAHVLTRYVPLRWQTIVHLVVLGIGCLFLPIAISPEASPGGAVPAIWLIGLFAVSVGAPFFALSANAPLLQRWFSFTSHPDAHDPYFLYAASNLGSLLALASYPLLVEPFLGLRSQSLSWTALYAVLMLTILVAGFSSLGRGKGAPAGTASPLDGLRSHADWRRRLRWVCIAAIPSALLLGVTSHLSANVAAAPFLWVMPLAIYLLTFVIAFSRKPPIRPALIETLFPLVVLALLVFASFNIRSFVAMVAANLLGFFVIAQYCHNKLAELRPHVGQLTEFYLAMSLGGVIGGAFTALVAPMVFNDVYEYPLLLVASVIVGASAAPRKREASSILIAFCVGLVPVVAAMFLLKQFSVEWHFENVVLFSIIFVAGWFLYRFRDRAVIFAAGVAGLAIGLHLIHGALSAGGSFRLLYQDRSFFGVMRVYSTDTKLGRTHNFTHGDTLHNVQMRGNEFEREPLLYYARSGPFGESVRFARSIHKENLRVAVIGLGAGAAACLSEPGEAWTFYEIDPKVIRMARNPRFFTYLENCTPDARLETGDARLKLSKEPEGVFDLILIDAFSSDSIPAHLITREAIALYTEKLSKNGLMFFHTSNRILDVSSVAVTLADDAGLGSRYFRYKPAESEPLASLLTTSEGVLVGAESALPQRSESVWRDYRPHPAVGVWTDDFSHIVGAIIARSDSEGYGAYDRDNP